MISGLIESGTVKKAAVTATDINPKRLAFIKKKYSVRTGTNNISCVKNNEIIVLAVKPQAIDGVLSEIKGSANSSHLVISIAAAITTRHIESFLGRVPVIRTMPNTPALVKEGMFGVCPGRFARKNHEQTAETLLSSMGSVLFLPERMMNAVTAVSGSGPAYVFYFAESMIHAARELGLSQQQARKLVTRTITGAAKMLASSDDTAETLRIKVTSPGGTTEQAIKHFQKNRLSSTIIEGIKRAEKRAFEIAAVFAGKKL